MTETRIVTQENNPVPTKAIQNPMTAFESHGEFNAELFAHLKANPEVWLRSSSFDGLGRKVQSEELEEKKVYFFACEMLDYDAIDPKSQQEEHYHYSVWLGVLEETGESIVYAAGMKLTKLAEDLLLPENEAIYNAVKEKGVHVYFPKMKRLRNGNSFMDPDLIP